MHLYADDDVRRVNAVWLGPRGWTFPFAARYIAWAVWFGITAALLLFEALTPLPMPLTKPIPVWESMSSLVFTFWVMGRVNHDYTVGAIVRDFRTELTGPREANHETRYQPRFRKVRVRSTQETPDA